MLYIAIILGLAAVFSWRVWRSASNNRVPPADGTPARITVRARLASFGYAFAGLKHVVANEHNAWIHLAAALLVVGVGIALKIDLNDWTWITLAIGWVWTAEIINTAIERACDAVSTEHNPLIGTAKDIAAGAVLVSAIGAGIIGVLRFAPYIAAKIDVMKAAII